MIISLNQMMFKPELAVVSVVTVFSEVVFIVGEIYAPVEEITIST